MPIRFLLDENLRGPMWDAVQRHNAAGLDPIDVVRVGDPADLPCGTSDPVVLLWAEREGRILESNDRKNMAAHLRAHLQTEHHCPGIFLVRRNSSVAALVFHLVQAAYAGDPGDFLDRVGYIP